MWITIFVVVFLNGIIEIRYSEPETRGQCETRRIAFNKSALKEMQAKTIWSVNSACVPADGDTLRKLS